MTGSDELQCISKNESVEVVKCRREFGQEGSPRSMDMGFGRKRPNKLLPAPCQDKLSTFSMIGQGTSTTDIFYSTAHCLLQEINHHSLSLLEEQLVTIPDSSLVDKPDLHQPSYLRPLLRTTGGT